MGNSNWKYKNLTLLIFSLLLLFLTAETKPVQEAIFKIGGLGFLGAVIVGVFFVSIFTVAPAALVLFHLAEELDPATVSLFAGIGAVIGDYLIFRFLKDGVFAELEPVFRNLGGSYLKKLFSTPYFSWVLPILGAAIIASPLPDEVGIGMMGLSKVKNWQFIAISLLLNTAGIFILLTLKELA